MTLLKKADTIRSPDGVKAWLVTTARNLTFDSCRKKKPLPMEMEKIQAAVDRQAEEKQWNQERLVRLEKVSGLIKELCDKEQDDTLQLFYCDGKSAKEIAELKGVALSTITNRLSRQRKKFSGFLKEHISNLWDQ